MSALDDLARAIIGGRLRIDVWPHVDSTGRPLGGHRIEIKVTPTGHVLGEPEEIPVPGAADDEFVNVRWRVLCSCGDLFRGPSPEAARAAGEAHVRNPEKLP